MNPYLNHGVKHLGVDTLTTYFTNLIETYSDIPIVSIGSGNGVVEKMLMDKLDIKIILIDPNPNSFLSVPSNYQKDISLSADYPTVQKLLKNNSTLKGNYIAFINWPFYGDSKYELKQSKNWNLSVSSP